MSNFILHALSRSHSLNLIFSLPLTGIPLPGDPRHTDGIVQSSHPGPSLSAWDLNSPYSSGLLLAAEKWLGMRRWSGSLPRLLGDPVGETPTEGKFQSSWWI